MSEVVTRITEAVRSDKPREKGIIGAMQLLQSPEQYEAFSRMMMLGTLLEGHADHVMDAVGPAHVPTVAAIREAFDTKRTARQSRCNIFRALIGMDAKMAQYVRGKAFVDEVVGTRSGWTFQRDLDLTGDDAVARRDRRAEKSGSNGCCNRGRRRLRPHIPRRVADRPSLRR